MSWVESISKVEASDQSFRGLRVSDCALLFPFGHESGHPWVHRPLGESFRSRYRRLHWGPLRKPTYRAAKKRVLNSSTPRKGERDLGREQNNMCVTEREPGGDFHQIGFGATCIGWECPCHKKGELVWSGKTVWAKQRAEEVSKSVRCGAP